MYYKIVQIKYTNLMYKRNLQIKHTYVMYIAFVYFLRYCFGFTLYVQNKLVQKTYQRNVHISGETRKRR